MDECPEFGKWALGVNWENGVAEVGEVAFQEDTVLSLDFFGVLRHSDSTGASGMDEVGLGLVKHKVAYWACSGLIRFRRDAL